MATNCCIPGCSWNRQKTEKRSLFTIRRPEFARNLEKQHREALRKFILTLRDYTKGDGIKRLLHKETAAICEIHFLPEDIVYKGSQKNLRTGALPSLKILHGTKIQPTTSRKPPLERLPLPLKVKHSCIADIKKSAERLSQCAKAKWIFYEQECKAFFIAERRDEGDIVPQLRVMFDRKAHVHCISASGWQVNLDRLNFPTIIHDSLYSFLMHLNSMHLCIGISEEVNGSQSHPILQWDGEKIVSTKIVRSPGCFILSRNQDMTVCDSCSKFHEKFREQGALEVDDNMHEAIKKLYEDRSCDLNDWQKLFFANQVKNSTTLYGRRYHPDIIRWAIEFFSRSPSGYEHVRNTKVLVLPSPSTIRNYRNFIKPEPGLNVAAVIEIERVMKDHESLPAYVTLDEMKIRENLVVRGGKIVGFVDYSTASECKLATHILVFYIRTICREISLPIAWYPTHGTPASQLAFYFWEVLFECETRGLQIHAVVADGATSNRRFFQLVGGPPTLTGYYTAPNPYAPTRPIFLCSDPSHLLKTARNSLLSSKPGGVRFMNMDGKDILWTHIRQLYETEKASLVLVRTRLTDAHIQLNARSKMNVGFAKDVLSYKVSQCLKTVPGAAGTSQFVKMMDEWFDIVNCSVKFPIRSVEDSRIATLRTFAAKLLAWKLDSEKRKEPKRMMALPTMQGLIFTSLNFVGLCERLLNILPYVCLHTFTQDVLEAFFGNLRQLGRRSQNPDVLESAYGIHHMTVRKSIKKIKGNATTFGKTNSFTSVSDYPMHKKKKL